MISHFLSFIYPLLVKPGRFSWGAHCLTLGALSCGLTIGMLPVTTAQGANVTASTTKMALLKAFPRQQTDSLGNPLSTDLATYRGYCSNPKDISQITALCVSLGVLTGENPDGSVEFENLTDGLPATSEPVNPEEVTSTPKPYPLGAVSPEQNDKVQLFASP